MNKKTPLAKAKRSLKKVYLFENCGDFLAFFLPYLYLSFLRGSLVKKPSLLRIGLSSSSTFNKALAIPCLTAPAWPVYPPPLTLTKTSNFPRLSVTSSGDLTNTLSVS